MTKLNGVKNIIMQVTYFLDGHRLNLLFYYHIILYWEKMSPYEKYSHNLTPEFQIVWKILAFWCHRWTYRVTCLLENLQSQKTFWLCCRQHIIFSVSKLMFVKWGRFFERNCTVKWVIFLDRFCLLWDFLLKNLKIKKQLL